MRGAARGLALAGLLGLGVLGGCAQLEQQGQLFQPAPGPAARPAQTAPRVDNRNAVQHKELIAQFGGEYRAPAAKSYLNGILAKLAGPATCPIKPRTGSRSSIRRSSTPSLCLPAISM